MLIKKSGKINKLVVGLVVGLLLFFIVCMIVVYVVIHKKNSKAKKVKNEFEK